MYIHQVFFSMLKLLWRKVNTHPLESYHILGHCIQISISDSQIRCSNNNNNADEKKKTKKKNYKN